MRHLLAPLLLCLSLSTAGAEPLALSIKGLDIQLDRFFVTALPAEEVRLGIYQHRSEDIDVTLDGTPIGAARGSEWRLKAPRQPGSYSLIVSNRSTGSSTQLALMVMVPYSELVNNQINGYRMDPYPSPRQGHESLYQVPAGFIEVMPEDLDLKLSKHFTLRQFLCKQQADWPRYAIVDERLLGLLEQIVPALQEAGHPVSTLGVISGYRTPFYNRSIGNVANSRHVYGNAFDWYVDVDNDGRMDDLNADGKLDGGDSHWLADFLDNLLLRPEFALFAGGLGRYAPTAHHGGFVHTDTRGFRARW